MKKTIFFSLLLIFSAIMFLPAKLSAQVTIGSTELPRATLDVRALDPAAVNQTPQGVIPPHVSIEVLDATRNLYTSAQIGAVVFVYCVEEESSETITSKIEEVGHHWFDGTYWQPLGGGGAVAATAVSSLISGTAIQLTLAQITTYDVILVASTILTPTTLVFPNLPEGTPAGRMLRVVNVGTQGPFTLPGYGTNPGLGIQITNNAGATFLWIGDRWARVG